MDSGFDERDDEETEARGDGGIREDSTLRERLQHVETTQRYLADTQDDIAAKQDEILDGINEVREKVPDNERIEAIESQTEHNRRYIAILKWVGTGTGILASSSVVAWTLSNIHL